MAGDQAHASSSGLLYKKANAQSAPLPSLANAIASAKVNAAEAEAAVKLEAISPASPSAERLSLTGKPSPRSKLDVLLRLQGLTTRAGSTSMKRSQQPHGRAYSEGGSEQHDNQASGSIHKAPQGAVSPRQLFNVPAGPHTLSRSLQRKEGQQAVLAIERNRRNMCKSFSQHSRQHSPPCATDSISDRASPGLGSRPSFSGQQQQQMLQRELQEVGGCFRTSMSVEPWLAAGVVQDRAAPDGSRALSSRGSGRRRSSGMGYSTPFARSPSIGMSTGQDTYASLSTASTPGKGVFRGAGSLGELGEQFGACRQSPSRDEIDFSAILKKAQQKPIRAAQGRRSGEHTTVTPPSGASSPHGSAVATAAPASPIFRKPPPLKLQQQQQQGQRPRSPGLNSAGQVPAVPNGGDKPGPAPHQSSDPGTHRSEGRSTSVRQADVVAKHAPTASASSGAAATILRADSSGSAAALSGSLASPGTGRSGSSDHGSFTSGLQEAGWGLGSIHTGNMHGRPATPTSAAPRLATIVSGAFGEAARTAVQDGRGGSGVPPVGAARGDLPAAAAASQQQQAAGEHNKAGEKGAAAAQAEKHLPGSSKAWCGTRSEQDLQPDPERSVAVGSSTAQAQYQPAGPTPRSTKASRAQLHPQPLSKLRLAPGEWKPCTPRSSSAGDRKPSARMRRHARAAAIVAARKNAAAAEDSYSAAGIPFRGANIGAVVSSKNGLPQGLVGLDPLALLRKPGENGACGKRHHRKSSALSLPSLSGTEPLNYPDPDGSPATTDAPKSDEHNEDGSKPAFNPLYGLPAFRRTSSVNVTTYYLLGEALNGDAGHHPSPRRVQLPNSARSPLGASSGTLPTIPGGPGSTASTSSHTGAGSSATAGQMYGKLGEDSRAQVSKRPRAPSPAKPLPAPLGYAARLAMRNAQHTPSMRKRNKRPDYAANTETSASKQAPASQPAPRGHPVMNVAPWNPSSCRSSMSLGGTSALLAAGGSANGGCCLLSRQPSSESLPAFRGERARRGSQREAERHGSRTVSAQVQETLQEKSLHEAANCITPEVLAQLGLNPADTHTTHQATASALTALRAAPGSKQNSEHGHDAGRAMQSAKDGILGRSHDSLGAFLTQAEDLNAIDPALSLGSSRAQSLSQHLVRLRSFRAGTAAPKSGSGLGPSASTSLEHSPSRPWDPCTSSLATNQEPESSRSVIMPTRNSVASMAAQALASPPKPSLDAATAAGGFGIPSRGISHSSSQRESHARNLHGPDNHHPLQRAGSSRSSANSQLAYGAERTSSFLPPLPPLPHKGPDAPGSYTSRLLASKGMQSQRLNTSPRASPRTPTHRRVCSLPTGTEGLIIDDLDHNPVRIVAPAAARQLGKSWAGVIDEARQGVSSNKSLPSSRDGVATLQVDDNHASLVAEDSGITDHSYPSRVGLGDTGKWAPGMISQEASTVPEARAAEEREAEDAVEEEESRPRLMTTPEGQRLLQQVPEGHTVKAALSELHKGVQGRVKGGLLQQWEQAEAAKEEKAAKKSARVCSCFGPPKPPPKKAPTPPQQQLLKFATDADKVTVTECGGPGGSEAVHVIHSFKHTVPWTKDVLVTLECGTSQGASKKVELTTATIGEHARVVLGLNAALLCSQKESVGEGIPLSTPLADLPWFVPAQTT